MEKEEENNEHEVESFGQYNNMKIKDSV